MAAITGGHSRIKRRELFHGKLIVPALTHEDPRYYTRGYGGLFPPRGIRCPVVLTRLILEGQLQLLRLGKPWYGFIQPLLSATGAVRKTAENCASATESAASNNIIKGVQGMICQTFPTESEGHRVVRRVYAALMGCPPAYRCLRLHTIRRPAAIENGEIHLIFR